jgi:hypothetical protein
LHSKVGESEEHENLTEVIVAEDREKRKVEHEGNDKMDDRWRSNRSRATYIEGILPSLSSSVVVPSKVAGNASPGVKEGSVRSDSVTLTRK